LTVPHTAQPTAAPLAAYPTSAAIRPGQIIFTGNFWEYFFTSLLLLLLSVLTLGLLLPYWAYWSLKYFFTRLRIEVVA